MADCPDSFAAKASSLNHFLTFLSPTEVVIDYCVFGEGSIGSAVDFSYLGFFLAHMSVLLIAQYCVDFNVLTC